VAANSGHGEARNRYSQIATVALAAGFAESGKQQADIATILNNAKLQSLHGAVINHGEKNHMNRKELIDALATKTESTKADADRNIAALIEIITATLKKGDNVALVGFGTFEVRKRAARVGRNPKTGAELKIKASKQPAFKAGATLKAAVNGAKK
jgi:DNA-binding protein HU-beta